MIDLNSLPPNMLTVRSLAISGDIQTETAGIEISCAGPISQSPCYSEGLFRQLLVHVCEWGISRWGSVLSVAEYHKLIDEYSLHRFKSSDAAHITGCRVMSRPEMFPSHIGMDINPLQLLCGADRDWGPLHRQSQDCHDQKESPISEIRSLLWSYVGPSFQGIPLDFYAETPDTDRWFQLNCYSSLDNLKELIQTLSARMDYIEFNVELLLTGD